MTTSPALLSSIEAKKYSGKTIGKAETAQIEALFRGGWYPREIASVTGRTQAQIENALWNIGYEPSRHVYSDKDVDQWVSMYEGSFDGIPMSIAEVARRAERSPGTVLLAILRRGVRDRHRSETMKFVVERRKLNRKH